MPLVRVHAKKDGGFRRAGRTWPTAPPLVVDVTDEEYAAIKAEPMLNVRLARPGEELTTETQVPAPVQSAPRDELEQALAGAIAKIEQLEATVDDLRKGNANVADQLSAARRENKQLEARAEGMSKSKANEKAALLETDLVSARKEIALLTAKLSETETTLDQLTAPKTAAPATD